MADKKSGLLLAAAAAIGVAALSKNKKKLEEEERERDYLLNEYVPKPTGPTKVQKCPKCGYMLGRCVYNCVVPCKGCGRRIYIVDGKAGWR